MKSEIKRLESFEVPTGPFFGELYMYPLGGWLKKTRNILPDGYQNFSPLIDKMISYVDTPVCYLTIDRK